VDVGEGHTVKLRLQRSVYTAGFFSVFHIFVHGAWFKRKLSTITASFQRLYSAKNMVQKVLKTCSHWPIFLG